MKEEELAFTRKMSPCEYDEMGAWSKNIEPKDIVIIKATEIGPKEKAARKAKANRTDGSEMTH